MYRVALLYRLGRFAYGADGKLHVVIGVNPISGTQSDRDTDFNAVNFSMKTSQYAALAADMDSGDITGLVYCAHDYVGLDFTVADLGIGYLEAEFDNENSSTKGRNSGSEGDDSEQEDEPYTRVIL